MSYHQLYVYAQESWGHSITLPLSLTWFAVACFIHLLDATSPCFISGGLDYHDPNDDSSGTVPPAMSCSYSLTIPIPAGSSAGEGVVAIINDTIYEGPENFFLDLSVAPAFHAVGIKEESPLRATVESEDDDGENEYFAICSRMDLTYMELSDHCFNTPNTIVAKCLTFPHLAL